VTGQTITVWGRRRLAALRTIRRQRRRSGWACKSTRFTTRIRAPEQLRRRCWPRSRRKGALRPGRHPGISELVNLHCMRSRSAGTWGDLRRRRQLHLATRNMTAGAGRRVGGSRRLMTC